MRGIVIDARLGSVRAWSYMIGHDVPVPIVARVLRDHAQCRREDRAARREGGRSAIDWLSG
jgi:hypothetical protein